MAYARACVRSACQYWPRITAIEANLTEVGGNEIFITLLQVSVGETLDVGQSRRGNCLLEESDIERL